MTTPEPEGGESVSEDDRTCTCEPSAEPWALDPKCAIHGGEVERKRREVRRKSRFYSDSNEDEADDPT